jgi:hypothetical protein
MTDRTRGFYVRYIERLADKHEADTDRYWDEWRANHEAASRHDEQQDRPCSLSPLDGPGT